MFFQNFCFYAKIEHTGMHTRVTLERNKGSTDTTSLSKLWTAYSTINKVKSMRKKPEMKIGKDSIIDVFGVFDAFSLMYLMIFDVFDNYV